MTGESERTLLEILQGLRLCLRAVGIEERKWFWFAEAYVYSKPQQWWPLLGRKYRQVSSASSGEWEVVDSYWYDILNVPTASDANLDALVSRFRPPFYDSLVANLLNPGFPSFVSLVQDNMDNGKAVRPLLRFLPRRVPEEEGEFDSSRWLRFPAPGFEVRSETFEAVRTYCENIRDKLWELKDLPLINGTPYPSPTLLVSVPLVEQVAGRSLLLALLVLFLDASSLESELVAQCFLMDLFRDINALAIQAQGYLLARHRHEIVGYLPTKEVYDFLAFPMLTLETFRQAVSMQATGVHGGLAHYPFGLLEWKYRNPNNGRLYELETAFELSTKPLVSSFSPENKLMLREADSLVVSDAVRIPLVGIWNKSLSELVYENEILCLQLFNSVHRWLKSLFAFEGSGKFVKSADHYRLFPENLCWLAAMASFAIKKPNRREFKGVEFFSDTTFEHLACAVWPPINGGEKCEFDDRADGLEFYFPVRPGVRFLIPWLRLASEIAQRADGNSDVHCFILRGGGIGGCPESLCKFISGMPFRRGFLQGVFLLIRKSEVNKEWPWKAIIEGWYLNWRRGRGHDANLIRDVVYCKTDAALRAYPVEQASGRRAPSGSSAYWDEIEGGSVIKDVFLVHEGEACVGFYWRY